jgi:DNA end-binding protein Ku
MVLETLRYADEVNKATPFFRDIGDAKPQEDLLDLATTLIEKKTGKFDASEFHDRYVDALRDLIERKRKGRKTSTEEEDEKPVSRGSNVIDLMAALKKSLEKPGAKPETTPAKTSTSRSHAKPASRARKPAARKSAARKRA